MWAWLPMFITVGRWREVMADFDHRVVTEAGMSARLEKLRLGQEEAAIRLARLDAFAARAEPLLPKPKPARRRAAGKTRRANR